MQQPQPQAQQLQHIIYEIERGSIKIPQFQREFVWSRDKSAKLMDSLLKGFPIGTFIIWKTNEELRSVRNLGDIQLPATPRGDSIQYVLDGQQRLTSLFATLKGLNVKHAGRSEDFGEMYVDLEAEIDGDLVIADVSDREAGTCIRVTDLKNKDFDELNISDRYREKIRTYRQVIDSYMCSVILVPEAKIDTATEIFTRINVTGKPLSAFEIMVAKTFDYERNFDLGQKTNELLDYLSQVDYGTIPDIVILQTIAAIMSKECSKKDILQLDKQQFIDTWPRAEVAICAAVDYLKSSFGIPVSQLLPYKAMLVPFAYFFANHETQPFGETQKRLHDFFWRVSLGGHYSFALETKLAQDIKRIDDIIADKCPIYDYPVNPTAEFVEDNGIFKTGRSFIKAILCLLAEQEPKNFKNNALVFISNDWLSRANSKNYHHFFPKGSSAVAGMDEGMVNHIANITIVDDYLNKRVIRARNPSDYIAQFQTENPDISKTMRTHLISNLDRAGVWNDDYYKFFKYRSRAIARRLLEKIIPQEVDSRGQPRNENDFENWETAQHENLGFDEE